MAVMGYVLLQAGGAAKGAFAALLSVQLSYTLYTQVFSEAHRNGDSTADAVVSDITAQFLYFHLLTLGSVAFYVWVVWFSNDTNMFLQRPKRVHRVGDGGIFFTE